MIKKLEVVSKYIDSNSFKFYIKSFMEIIPYLHLANNYNKYYFIITNETENDIIQINNHLLNNSKNPEFELVTKISYGLKKIGRFSTLLTIY